jgi:hypothetical protein
MFFLSVGRAESRNRNDRAYHESLIGFATEPVRFFACIAGRCSYALEICNRSNDISLCNENPTLSYPICGECAPASLRIFGSTHRVRVSGVAVSRTRVDFPWRDARLHRQWHLMGRAHRCADYWNQRFLARPYPAGKNCAQKNAPADEGDSVPLPAVALLRRAALADRVALGLLETGAAQARLRH